MIDLIPIGLAIIAIVFMSRQFMVQRRKRDKLVLFLGCLTASIMIVAQLSWWSTFVLQNKLFDEWYVNYIWTLFNSLVMIVFILIALPRKHEQNIP